MEYGQLIHASSHISQSLLPLSMQLEKVKVKHEAPDNWYAWYEGKWRKVRVQLRRLYIVYMGKKININIDGV